MDYLPNIKIIENSDIEVYCNNTLPIEFIERLSNSFSKHKKYILEFFRISSFRKVRINLFNDKNNYYNFSTQYIKISSYSEGNCCNGMINYIYSASILEDFLKARLPHSMSIS